ncbi:LLM class flavin-dependent oxidoreductase [Cryobacterium breve]|uniref:LLM class flavin-dependent oxidoreductase n=1 Tax=Cryobacterium breve TaxID=1259258 RepID=A0ABY7N8K3_9MICO|nr:LLM class flavin-dependent oxidoreductase [Cryobacterium breve]WBM78829.1 LLM class flavin-dependent oxidoreductase [Cryobacterium breve]
MELGAFSLTDLSAGTLSPGRVLDIIDYGVFADEAGLDIFGIGEHHTPRFAVSSPAVVLAAIAARTSTITLTSAVSVLSVLDPDRLYQDFAQLDLVSGGRAEITAGRSAYSEPFAVFGVPLDDYDAVFEEKLGLLLALRRNAEVTWTGRFRTPLDHAQIIPRLTHELPVRLGVGGTPASAARAERLGLPVTLALLAGGPDGLTPVVNLYRQTGDEHGHLRGQLGVGVVSHVYVGNSSQDARDTFYPHYRSYFADGRGINLDRATFDRMAAPDGPLVVGSPQEVADKLLRWNEIFELDRFLGQIDIGGLPRDAVFASIERFAVDVAPMLRRKSSHYPSERALTPPPDRPTIQLTRHPRNRITHAHRRPPSICPSRSRDARLRGDEAHPRPQVVAQMEAVKVTRQQMTVLGVIESAATVGLIVGIFLPSLAVVASAGVIAYFLGALVAHLRAQDRNIQGVVVFLLLAVASLTLLLSTQ